MKPTPIVLDHGMTPEQRKIENLIATATDIDDQFKACERRTDYAELATAKLRILEELKEFDIAKAGDTLKDNVDDLIDKLADVTDDLRRMDEDPSFSDEDPDIPRLEKIKASLEKALDILTPHTN